MHLGEATESTFVRSVCRLCEAGGMHGVLSALIVEIPKFIPRVFSDLIISLRIVLAAVLMGLALSLCIFWMSRFIRVLRTRVHIDIAPRTRLNSVYVRCLAQACTHMVGMVFPADQS